MWQPGWEQVWGRMDACICMAESLHCSPEAITTLLIGYVVMLVAQSCPDLWDPMDCSPPGSPVHEIFQIRIWEWVAIPFSRRIFPTQGSDPSLPHCRQILYRLSHQGSPQNKIKSSKEEKKKKTQWVKVDSLTRTALINTIFNGAVRQGRKIFRDEVQESAFYEIFPHDVWPGLGITALEDSLSVRNDWLQSTAVKVKRVHLYGNCFPAGTKANTKTK